MKSGNNNHKNNNKLSTIFSRKSFSTILNICQRNTKGYLKKINLITQNVPGHSSMYWTRPKPFENL